MTANLVYPPGYGAPITGAAGYAQLVGSNASGAPTTGSHVVGEVAVDQTGNLWVCTAAGTPGTWTPPGGGIELAYAENITGTTQVIGAGGNADITNCSITIPPWSRPVYIEAAIRGQLGAVVGTPGAGVALALVIYEGATPIEIANRGSLGTVANTSTHTLYVKARLGASTSGSRTFKINVIAPGTGSNGFPFTVSNSATVRSWIGAYTA